MNYKIDYDKEFWDVVGDNKRLTCYSETAARWLCELLNSDMQYTSATQEKPIVAPSAGNIKTLTDNFTDADGRELPKSYSELQSQLEESLLLYNNQTKTIFKLESLLKEKEDEIRLLEEREVLWSNKHQLLNDEILKYKALAEAADKLIALNGWGNEQEWVTYKKLKDDIQSKN